MILGFRLGYSVRGDVMIFNEIYGCYYNAVAKIISKAIEGRLDEKEMNKIAMDLAFEESHISISSSLKKQEWQLIDKNFKTPIKRKPTMPLTTLEKRWLKTICNDKRAKLFDIPSKGLEDVEPLFNMEDIVCFDRYTDGDDYDNPDYVSNFRKIVEAIREGKYISVRYMNRKGRYNKKKYCPIKIEYSDKDDKFRLICSGHTHATVLNLKRIDEVEILPEQFSTDEVIPSRQYEKLVLEIHDTRNTLERTMMKFAHFKKQVERIDDDKYIMTMEYDKEDGTDILIQVMSFGRFVKILEPTNLREEMKKRLERQLEMLQW